MSLPVSLNERSAWRVQASVVWALYLRETKTRFGRYELGLIWALIEPLSMVVIKSLIFGYFLQLTVPSIPYPIFLMAGYVPFRFFTGMLTRNLTAVTANQGLLVYPQVKPLDTFLARFVMEALIFALSIIIFLTVAAWLGSPVEIHRPLEILVALFSLAMMGSGLSIYCGVLARQHPEIEKVVPLVTQPLLFVSCVLYPLSAIPADMRVYFIWNPLVVVFETFRQGLFPRYSVPAELPLWYPACLGIFFLWLGLSYYRKNLDSLYLPPKQ